MTRPDALKVAFVAPYGRFGGAERYLQLLLENLPEAWVQSIVFLQEGEFVDRIRELGHRVEVVPTSPKPADMLRSAWALRRLLRRDRPDVVHANGVKAALVAGLAVRGLDLPVVWVKHDFSFDGRLARAIALGCACVIGPTRAATATLGARASGKVRIVPHGLPPVEVDRPRMRAAVLASTDLADPSSVVALVGRLHPVKGHLELVELAPELARRVPGLRILFVGGTDSSVPSYRERLERRIRELDVSHLVTFAGHRADALDFIGGSDVLVIPSGEDERGMGREVLSYVALEALAVGTPTVAYADGGLPETLGDCGHLVAPGDRAALGAAIVSMLRNAELRERLAACGRERARHHYSLSRWIAATMSCYREVARG